jgi:hypothetical protein
VRLIVLFSQQTCNLWDWDVNQTSNPQARRMGCLCLSGTSLSTCPTWGALPVAMLSLAAYFLISFDHTPPPWQSRGTIREIVPSLLYTLHT